MNQLPMARRVAVLAALVAGDSIRATARLTGAAKGTVLKLLADIGTACRTYQDGAFRQLPCKRLRCEETWSFVGAKDRNLTTDDDRRVVWTWTAICADTKLVPSFCVSTRDARVASDFIHDLAARLAFRVRLRTDGDKTYVDAVEDAAGENIDYALLAKTYGEAPAEAGSFQAGTEVLAVPDGTRVETKSVESQNPTRRMLNRPFAHLTAAFSKKVEKLEHAVALHVMHHNFCRVHHAVGVTPAMHARVADHVWNLEELLMLDRAPISAVPEN